MIRNLFALAGLFILTGLTAQSTRTVYLSGTGFDDTVEWDFYCTGGMNSGRWTTIRVPSCWEQQGFGEYNYGHVPFDRRMKEEGRYRYRFVADQEWQNRHVELVFEGVMTDCRVVLNGRQAGEVHQGAFYRFSYDVTRLLRYGEENLLEVFVKKHSDNISVNQAERKADYWIFGGIFRPVYLEIKPAEHIRRVAVDARADGSFRSEITLAPGKKHASVRVEILDGNGKEIARFSSEAADGREKILLHGAVDRPLTWSPEFPHLYTALFKLLDGNGSVIHTYQERIGFRTVDVREQDGIYVNGVRIKFKGVNRHSFHPDHGRTSCKAYSIEVVNLIKDMNMNAVRMSHYPPDRHFLDVCDSLGLFVLDELAGWQRPPYDSVVGRKLLEEMITRDVNHPSVVMWDNGNEGGWNTAYDEDFRDLDIQRREVNHPWAAFGKTNTAHYVNYDYLSQDHFAPRSIFFPTELLHGLYDGGHGAGLEDFWLRMWNHPLSAGGFLWVFADEAVKRTDSGQLDSDGNQAPDGILGPYHEKEGSFYAIREIWSPVYFEKRYVTEDFNGIFRIQNRFHYTGLDQCSFSFRLIELPKPDRPGTRDADAQDYGRVVTAGIPVVDPLEPGQNGTLKVPLPDTWMEAGVLEVEARDPHGRLICRWSWPVQEPLPVTEGLLQEAAEKVQEGVSVSETERSIILECSGVEVRIAKRDGMLEKITSGGRVAPLAGGPLIRSEPLKSQEVRHFNKDGSHYVVIDYGEGNRLEWIMHGNGLLDMNLHYQPGAGSVPFTGASFRYPEEEIRSVRYMGNGPYRVWKNRMKGVHFNVWEKDYNNTITGHSGYVYPEFKGYYSNLYWARFTGKDASFMIYSRTADLFLGLFSPEEAPDPARTTLHHPPGGISFMLGIPAIGTKFKEAEKLGPQSRDYQFLARRVKNGELSISLIFDFRE
ncbi:MAG TPA: hypothetical protein ENO20_07060 [Bacteroides sp.]|nr:hypothetical protein [Bacteroides sp.]